MEISNIAVPKRHFHGSSGRILFAKSEFLTQISMLFTFQQRFSQQMKVFIEVHVKRYLCIALPLPIREHCNVMI